MAKENRHLRDETNEILVPIKGNVEVDPGDFMFNNGTAGSIGVGNSVDGYAYPFDSAVNTASPATGIINAIYTNFIGVALTGSESGVSNNITVATAGVFRYPLYSAAGVTIGALVSSVSTNSSAKGASPQHVAITGAAIATTAYLGYVVKTESGASFVDIDIRTSYTGLAS